MRIVKYASRFMRDYNREAICRRNLECEPLREIAGSYNVSHSTISKLTA